MALTFRILCEEDQELYDPTGKARAFLARLVDSSPNPQAPITRRFSRGEWQRRYIELRTKLSLHSALLEFDAKHDTKYAPQGGTYSLEKLVRSLSLYYSLANRKVYFDRVDYGVEYLIRRIRHIRSRVGYPQPVELKVYHTSGALPTMSKKGSFHAETCNARTHRHVFPVLPGERIQRNGSRVIFQDACQNVRYIEQTCASIRNWLKHYLPEYFSAWLNPKDYQYPHIYDVITRGGFVSIETDYTKCDQHMSWDIVQRTYLRICRELIPDPMEYLLFEHFIEELFEQEVYLGKVMVQGEHNLFSGQVITNESETIYDVCVTLGTLISCNMQDDLLLLLANGDDLAVVLRDRGEQQQSKYLHALIEEMELNGHEISREKSRVSRTDIQFCRRLFNNKSGPVLYNADGHPYRTGFYPTSLALNGIINPERSCPPNQERPILIQRLDNCYGNTNFVPFVQFVGKSINWDGFSNDNFSVPTDWWDRLYGESWNPDTSPAIAILRKSGIITKF